VVLNISVVFRQVFLTQVRISDSRGEEFAEVVDGGVEALVEGNSGLPAEFGAGEGDVGLALLGIIAGEGLMGDFGFSADFFEHFFGELEHGEFAGVADVDRAGERRVVHEADEALDQVVHVAERAGLGAIAVDGEILAAQGLDDEVGNDAAVIGMHARAVGVENPDDADVHAVLAVVVHEEGLGATFPLVITRADADGVDVSPVALRLRVDGGIAIDFGGAGLEHAGLGALGEAEAVDGSHDRGFDRLDGIVLVMRRGGGAGEVVDLIDLELEGVDDVVTDQFERGMADEVEDVAFAAGEKVVEADDFVAFMEKPLAEVGAKESRTTGDQNAHGGNAAGKAMTDKPGSDAGGISFIARCSDKKLETTDWANFTNGWRSGPVVFLPV